jgi:hypothetical protein
MSQYYFQSNGNWGKRDNLTLEAGTSHIIIPTTHWTDSMFKLIDECLSSERMDLAQHFNLNVHRIFTGKCQICKLSSTQLEGQHLVDKD